MAKKTALGRGLSEILGEVREAYENNMGSHRESVVELEIDSINPNPYQPRKSFDQDSLIELSSSIQEYGLLQPILVYKEDDRYILIAGERRLRASKLIHCKRIKAIVVDIDLNRLREVALIENIQREDLNPIDLAKAYEELILAHHLTHEELAHRIQKSRTQITNTLRLLNLHPNVQHFLIEGKITQGHAKILVGLEQDKQEKIAQSIIGQKLSVRETEGLIRGIKKPQTFKKKLSQDLISDETREKITKILNQHQISFQFLNDEKRIVISLKNQEQIEHFLGMIAK